MQAQGVNKTTASSELAWYHNSNGVLTKNLTLRPYDPTSLIGAGGAVVGETGGGLGFYDKSGSNLSGIQATASAGYVYVVITNALALRFTSTEIRPQVSDNTMALGDSAQRFSELWAPALKSGSTAMTFDTTVAAGSARKGFQWSDANTTTTIATTDLIAAFRAGTTNKLTLSGAGVVHAVRHSYDLGTSLVAGDFALSAGWGSTASIGSLAGSDANWYGTVTTAGTGLGANPTIVLTFKDGTFTAAPNCIVKMSSTSDATNTATAISWTTTATALTITFRGTPVVTNTFVFNVQTAGVV